MSSRALLSRYKTSSTSGSGSGGIINSQLQYHALASRCAVFGALRTPLPPSTPPRPPPRGGSWRRWGDLSAEGACVGRTSEAAPATCRSRRSGAGRVPVRSRIKPTRAAWESGDQLVRFAFRQSCSRAKKIDWIMLTIIPGPGDRDWRNLTVETGTSACARCTGPSTDFHGLENDGGIGCGFDCYVVVEFKG